MMLYTIVRKKFNGRYPTKRAHRTVVGASQVSF